MSGLTTRQLTGKRERVVNLNQKSQLQPGDILQGRYRIMGTLGVGGFSAVYQARDLRFANVTKLCAIKEMTNLASDPHLRELTIRSFEREASILATLDHPAIVDVYDFFSESDRSYLVQEFIRGKDLDAYLEANEGKVIPQEQVIDWALQLTDVLIYLHSQKPLPIVFRDLKPSNIMLDPFGRITLIDFGIAKIFEGGEKGTMVGTEGYSPPEQYRGEATTAGDIYALGATLHHLLTLQDPRLEPPFSFTERPIRALNSTVSPALEAIIMRCLSYQTKDRYQTGMEFKDALLTILQAGTPTSPTTKIGTGILATPIVDGKAKEVSLPNPREETISTTGSLGIVPLWMFKCEDEIRSKPAVDSGLVFVGAFDNNLYAVKANSGEFFWKYPATDEIASSPFVYNHHVYIGSADNHLYCVKQHNGRLNWRFETQGPVYSSPRAEFDHVFFGSDDAHLYAVNASNGKLAWKTQVHGAVRSSPCIHDELIIIGTEGGYIFAVDLSGKIKWQYQARRAIVSTPVVVDDMVIFGSYDATIYALDVASGWAVWQVRTKRPIVSSPVVSGDMLFIGSSDGSLYAIDIRRGHKMWSFDTDGQVASSPAIWERSVYFGSTDGYVYSVDMKRGQKRWRFDTGSMVISSPTIVDGILYIGSTNKTLYALPV
ncbi:MAG: serine/threonine-protein kinase [Chloroflexi bacterium]|nr:serine/threonine-protein kinase [Chloroflexota bacterium]